MILPSLTASYARSRISSGLTSPLVKRLGSYLAGPYELIFQIGLLFGPKSSRIVAEDKTTWPGNVFASWEVDAGDEALFPPALLLLLLPNADVLGPALLTEPNAEPPAPPPEPKPDVEPKAEPPPDSPNAEVVEPPSAPNADLGALEPNPELEPNALGPAWPPWGCCTTVPGRFSRAEDQRSHRIIL